MPNRAIGRSIPHSPFSPSYAARFTAGEELIRSAVEHDANAKVLRHLVSLCDSLGFAVVAEGVETPEQYERMRELGVSHFQGYLFARPLTSEDFAERFLQPA